MKPIYFEGANCIYGQDQPEYMPLPAKKEEDGTVLTCWEVSPEDLAEIQRTGVIYLSMLTFNQALQPVLLSTTKEI